MRKARLFLLLAACLVAVSTASCGALNALKPAPTPTPTPAPTPTPEPPSRVRVPILLYHHLTELSAKASNDWYESTVTPQAFDEQMAYLVSHNFHAVTIMDVVAALQEGRPLPDNPVAITFDDGREDCYSVAFPILRKYGLVASFFIPANWVDNLDNMMTWPEIEELSKAGMEIGSHSMTHPYLIKSKPDMLTWELENSKARIEKYVGKPVEVFAYPFGLYDDNVIAQTKAAGYRAAVTIEHGIFATRDNLFQLHRIGIPYNTTLEMFAADLQNAGVGEDASGG